MTASSKIALEPTANDDLVSSSISAFKAGTPLDAGRLLRAMQKQFKNGDWTRWVYRELGDGTEYDNKQNKSALNRVNYYIREAKGKHAPKEKTAVGVYVIGFPERNEFKIGCTRRGLTRRLRPASTWWAKEPTYKRFWPCKNAQAAEREAHRAFRCNRVSLDREWFLFTAKELKHVEHVLSSLTDARDAA